MTHVPALHPAGAVPERMLVVARGKEDVSWLSLYLPDIPHTVYQVWLLR